MNKEEIEFIQDLFNFNGDQAHLKHLKEAFLSLIQNSINGPNYYIYLLNFYLDIEYYK